MSIGIIIAVLIILRYAKYKVGHIIKEWFH